MNIYIYIAGFVLGKWKRKWKLLYHNRGCIYIYSRLHIGKMEKKTTTILESMLIDSAVLSLGRNGAGTAGVENIFLLTVQLVPQP